MDMGSSSGPPAAAPATLPQWVLLAHEARVRGFRNALAFRRWCRRRGVPIRTDGKLRWVSPAEVDKAVAGISTEAPPRANGARAERVAVADAVADLIMGGGRPRR
jgi:hypothetical protein